MNLFDSILKNSAPKIPNASQDFLSGFTPSNDIFTGKTTSEKIASGEIKARTLSPSEIPREFQKKQPSFLESFDPNSIGNAVNNFAGNVSSYWNNTITPETVQNLQATNNYHTQESLANYIRSKNITREQAQNLVYSLMNSGHVIQGINDKVDQNPSFMRGGEIGKFMGGLGTAIPSGFSSGLQGGQNIVSGIGNISKGNIAEGASQIGLGALEGTMPTMTAAFPIGSSYFGGTMSTTPGEKTMGFLHDVGATGTKYGQEALGFNPNSPASKNVQEIGGQLLPMASLYGFSKGGEKLAGKMKGPEKYKTPEMEKGQNAISSENVPFTLEQKPGVLQGTRDYMFGTKDNVDLANRSVFPNMTKEKGTNAKLNAGNTALEGVTQMHNDVRTGKVEADISTMRGGADAIEQGMDYWGKKIGELTKNESTMNVDDLVGKLESSLKDPYSQINTDLHGLGTKIVNIFNQARGNISIEQAQRVMSNIKSEIFNNAETVKKLYKTDAGVALRSFLDEFSNRFEKTIESTSGNLPELLQAKSAYAKYAKIQKDFMRSLMANERNSKTGALGKAGSVVGLYELFKNPSLSGIATSILTKTVLNEMGHAKTRGGAYENLIRNLDRQSLLRAKGIYNKGDKSIIKPKKINGNTGNNSSSVASERPVGVKTESSKTQATGPRVLGKMGKVKTKPVPQSPVAGERGYTTAIKKPIVKRASDASMETKKLIEEAKQIGKNELGVI